MSEPKFKLGQLVMTAGVSAWLGEGQSNIETPAELHHVQIGHCIFRHERGDWGVIDPEDAASNDEALALGNRVMSVYDVAGRTIWIITEATRECTTVLFPSDY